MSLQLSEKFSLPKESVLWTFLILAIRGAGKSYDAAKMAEQMMRLGFPIVVFDPMGIWWGLRVGINGGDGLPIVIFGGQHADLPIPTRPGKAMAHIIDEQKLRLMVNAILKEGLSVVLDTSELSITQQTRTIAIFGDELFRRNASYGVRHVFIEEADVYCPQKPRGETQESHTAIDNLVRRGGNYNLGVTMITQRAAVLDKDVLSQANCLIAMRLMWDPDKKTVETWVKSKVTNEREVKKLDKWYDSLKDLRNGEAWVYSPEHSIFERVQFGERETLHASREFFLKETWEQKNITLRDVSLFVKAYKAKIEPKPIVQASQIGTQPGVPVSASPTVERLEVRPSEPVVPTGNPPAQIDILRVNPVIQTQRSTVNIVIPTDALHPLTAEGKLGVVMKDDAKHNQNWSLKRARREFEKRQWSVEGIEQAFNQYITLGILRMQSNRLYSCYTARIELTEKTVNVVAP